ncbi:hypothetical protein [Evansella cellulosilytica]|uniref:Uncharacterized protein n=1 Tax=Evansella cellulosilytica (strain ATCC 21833 / DSM 2522 / FERM P-1141 / JCM 9156 / N-4) TaxID=649639 RepID=E6U1M5_EVAC2|nr:hypothetical protein [Evansella cellulosilytica]ADU30388.1 hypothetical protein Bcell_2127 [Evansella cellulosilytica DSM 2522]
MEKATNLTVVKEESKNLEGYIDIKLTVSEESKSLIELIQKVESLNNTLPGDEVKLLVEANGKLKPIEIHDISANLGTVFNTDTEEVVCKDGERL